MSQPQRSTMGNRNKTNQKDAPWLDNKYMPPEKNNRTNDREYGDRYRHRSPSWRDSYTSRPRNDWRYDQNRERYQNYHGYGSSSMYGERRWSTYNAPPMYTFSANPHASRSSERPPNGKDTIRSDRLPHEGSNGQPSDAQQLSGNTDNTDNTDSKTQNKTSSIIIKRVKNVPTTSKRNEEHYANSYRFITEHLLRINQSQQTPQTTINPHNALLNKLIADEAIRMLTSAAAASNKPTGLNDESCDTDSTANASTVATNSSNKASPRPPVPLISTKPFSKAAVTADNALLQKSAEQVTRKLINQLTTMNKYNLKQMIDNPAGKYETALNKHAQSKLRAEVRNQLKNFSLAEAVGSKDGAFGSDVLAPDEAIDAEKIPSELLEQIGHALDMDFFDLTSGEGDTEADCSTTVENTGNQSATSADKSLAGKEGAIPERESTEQRSECGLVSDGGQATQHVKDGQENVTPAVGGVEPGKQLQLGGEQTLPAKTISFLRVSTVDELNKRLEINADDGAPSHTDRVAEANNSVPSETLPPSGARLCAKSSSSLGAAKPCHNEAKRSESASPIVAPSAPIMIGASNTNSPKLPALPIEETVSSTTQPKETPQHKQISLKKRSNNNQRLAGGVQKRNQSNDPAALTDTMQQTNPSVGKKKKTPKKRSRANPNLPVQDPNGAGAVVAVNEPVPLATGTNKPIRKSTKVSRWDNGFMPTNGFAANGESDHAKPSVPEQIEAAQSTPQNNGKRCLSSSPTLNVNIEQSGENSGGTIPSLSSDTLCPVNSKRSRQEESYDPPTDAPAVLSTEEETAIKMDNDQSPDENERGDGFDIRISSVQSLLEVPETMAVSDSAPTEELTAPEVVVDCMSTAATQGVSEPTNILINVSRVDVEPFQNHMDCMDAGNLVTSPPHQRAPEVILPDLVDPPRQQPTGLIMNQMQAIDTKMMELFNRKMEIDAQIMKLNGERMEIDQAIVKLQNTRDEQMHALRFALLLPFSAGEMQPSGQSIVYLHPTGSDSPIDGTDEQIRQQQHQQQQQQASGSQERTIRRITKLSANTELMRIFQRRRLLSDRSSDDNPSNEDGTFLNDLH